jgi:uncharacterized delta-60 repeat protein
MVHRVLGTILVLYFLLAGATEASAQAPMRVEASTRQADGKILIAGQATNSYMSITVGRLNADGTVDRTFVGGSGWLNYSSQPNVTSEFRVTAITTQPDGKIVLALVQDGSVALLRLDSYGSPDSAFGDSASPGLALDSQSQGLKVNALAADAAGNLLAFGSYSGAATGNLAIAALARYTGAGVRDTAFGSGPGGVRIVPNLLESGLRAAIVTGSGAIAAAGYSGPSYSRSFLVAQFLANGDLDTGFAGSGWTTVHMASYVAEAYGIGLDAAGNIMAVGRDGLYPADYSYPSSFALARLTAAGTLLETIVRPIPSGNAATKAIAMAATALSDGDLLIAGTVVEPSTGRSHFGLTRTVSGALVVGPTADNDDDLLLAAYATGDGQVVAVGTRESWPSDFARRARYFADNLEFDTDFAQEGYDFIPNPFSFAAVSGAALSEVRTSAPARISGIDQPTYMAVQGGSYSVGCAEPYTTVGGLVLNGQRVCVRATSASTPGTTTSAVLTVGGVQASFTITTFGPPQTRIDSAPPDPSSQSVIFYYSADTASGVVTGYECHLDSDPFVACPSGHAGAYVSVGTHTFEVRGVNAYGADPTPASYTWTARPPPETTITSGPGANTNQTSAIFTFTASNPSATFQCMLDNGSFDPCASPKTYTGLAPQSTHSFQVKAFDPYGLDPTPATYSWTIDTTVPDTRISSWPSSPTSSTTATFIYLSLGESTSIFDCSLDGGAWTACNGGSVSVSVGVGSHSMAIRARDAAGNVDATPAGKSWEVIPVDVTPPETTITSGPSGTVTSRYAYFSYASTETGSTFECNASGGYFSGNWYSCAAGATDFYNLPDGTYTFQVRARDAAGNTDLTPDTRTWTVSAPAPDTLITSGPSGSVSSTTATFGASSDQTGVSYECSLDGAAFAACPYQYTGLAQGSHTIRIRAVLGIDVDDTPAERTWIVDTVYPDTTIDSAPGDYFPSNNVTFTFSSNEAGATFQCAFMLGTWFPCTSPYATTLANGGYSFQVRAIDLAGNVDPTYASRNFSISTIPDTTITGGPSGTVAQTAATFTFTSNEAGVTFYCWLDTIPLTQCTSPYTVAGLADGQHSFLVYSHNSAGNDDATPARRDWTVDTVLPMTSITSGPNGVVNSTSATFAFAASETGAAFTCSLDGAPEAACTSPVSYPNLPEGSHAFAVTATDAAGNRGASANRAWQVDLTSPDTSITTGPSGTVSQTAATFTFASGDASAAFECSLDSAPFAACTNGASFTGLAEGMHLFEVRARDAAGNADGSPASRSWSIDTTNPNTTVSSGPAVISPETGAVFVFSSSEGGTFMCRLDAAPAAACTSPQSYVTLGAGAHSFSVYAIDAAGNADASPATWSWTIDITAPDTSLSGGPTGSVAQTAATFSFTSPDAGATFECRLDGAAYAPCASPQTLSGLSSSAHVFDVRAKDAAGNVDPTPASRSWTVDATAPDTTLTASPAAVTNATGASFSFTATEAGTFECKLDAGAFAACTSAKSYSGLAAGSHTFQVRAKDALGNTDASPATWTWTIDTTAPDTTITGGPSGTVTATSATFTFTATQAGSTFECKLDTGAYAACATPKTYAGLAKGNHTFTVRAKDPAGNTDASPATRTWRIN